MGKGERKGERETEELLEFFEPFFGFKVNYKYIERLYSDEYVKLVFHNVFIHLLHLTGISGKFCGDGSGYSLLITKHYRTNPKKKIKDFRYVFRLIDLETGMYVAVGYSSVSEMDAFHKAMHMVKRLGISIDSIALDKHYSSRKVLNLFSEKTSVYLIPKKNISRIGPKWAKILRMAVNVRSNYRERHCCFCQS